MAKESKRPEIKIRPTRNSMCPCGSGRAYKNCCGKVPASKKVEEKSSSIGHIILIAVICFLVVGGMIVATLRPQPKYNPADHPPADGSNPTGVQHWDAEHGHMHDGAAPGAATAAPTQAPAASPGSAAPWEYDAAANRHWNPTHGHWHDGPPPPVNQR